MLEGITVLNEYTVQDLNLFVFAITAVIIGIGALVLGIWLDADYLSFLIAIVGIVIIAVPVGLVTGPTLTRYECLIDESVSMTDVYERYKIIEQRGDIWVLEDKE